MKTFWVFREGLVAGYESIDIKGLSYGNDWLNAAYRAGKRIGRFAARLFHHEPEVYELRMNCETRTNAGEFVRNPLPMSTPEEAARRLLDSLSEPLGLDPGKLAWVAGQFITPDGHQVYPVRLNGRRVYVTVPED